MATIPVTNVSGQRVIALGATNQPFNWAKITINRSGTGGTNPWLNSLTSADTLGVFIEYSLDGGQTWKPTSAQTFGGGSQIVKGVTVPTDERGRCRDRHDVPDRHSVPGDAHRVHAADVRRFRDVRLGDAVASDADRVRGEGHRHHHHRQRCGR
jgi:hypothetical protein